MLPLTVGGGPVTGGALRPTSAPAPFFFFDVLLTPLTLTTWPMGVIFTCEGCGGSSGSARSGGGDGNEGTAGADDDGGSGGAKPKAAAGAGGSMFGGGGGGSRREGPPMLSEGPAREGMVPDGPALVAASVAKRSW